MANSKELETRRIGAWRQEGAEENNDQGMENSYSRCKRLKGSGHVQ
jgi:hypothetical protein